MQQTVESKEVMRAILDITAETLAITRESILANQAQIESHQRLEVVATHTDTGIHTIIKTTGLILGITQRLEQYRSGRYTLFDEWLVFWTFLVLHPIVPSTLELFGSCMLYVLTLNRLFHLIPVYPSLYSYLTSPYKAIFLLYWFTNEYATNAVVYQTYVLPFPHIEALTFVSYDPTTILITFARWIVISVSSILYSVGYGIVVGCFAVQINKYLLLELYVIRSCLYGLGYILSIMFHGVFTDMYKWMCEIQFTIPFYMTVKPFYYIC